MFARCIPSIFLFLLSLSFTVSADAECLTNALAQVFCAPVNGSILINGSGQIVCGPGQCSIFHCPSGHCGSKVDGQVFCSQRTGGEISFSSCDGGCFEGNISYCVRPK